MTTATLAFLKVDDRTAIMCGVFAAHLMTQNRHAEAARWEQIWIGAGRPDDPAQRTDAHQTLDRLLRMGAHYSAGAATATAGAYATAHQLPPVRINANPPPVAPTAPTDALALAAERVREAPDTVRWLRRATRRETLPPLGVPPTYWRATRRRRRAWLRRLIVYGRAIWMLTLDALIQLQLHHEILRAGGDADQVRQRSAELVAALNRIGRTVQWATVRLDRFEADLRPPAHRPRRRW